MAREPRPPGGVGGWVVLSILLGIGVVFKALGEASTQLGPAASIPIWFVTIGGAALVLRGPVGTAIGQRLSGHGPVAPGPAELPEELYAELDELRTRVAELEERQDFSERLLARREEPPASN